MLALSQWVVSGVPHVPRVWDKDGCKPLERVVAGRISAWFEMCNSSGLNIRRRTYLTLKCLIISQDLGWRLVVPQIFANVCPNVFILFWSTWESLSFISLPLVRLSTISSLGVCVLPDKLRVPGLGMPMPLRPALHGLPIKSHQPILHSYKV